jgi:hypothetical protein
MEKDSNYQDAPAGRIKSLTFAVALIGGAIAAAFLASNRGLGSGLHVGALSFQDAALWFFGLAMIGSCLWRLSRGASIADWRPLLALALGALVTCGEVFDILPVKELACQALLAPRHHHVSPCYKGALSASMRAGAAAASRAAGR